MRVPALFQHCSSKREKNSFVNQSRSTCSRCSSAFTRTRANTRKESHTHIFSRARISIRLEHLEQVEHSCFYYVLFFALLEQCWNTSGTAI